MHEFYQRALKGEVTKFKYPDIKPECMASLETLLHRDIKVQDVMFQLLYAIKDLGGQLNMDPLQRMSGNVMKDISIKWLNVMRKWIVP